MSRTSLLLPLLAVALSAGCGAATAESTSPRQPAGELETRARTRVEVAEMRRVPASIDLELNGEIEGWRDANLASALGGFVERVPTRPGERVRAGQLLVAIDREVYAAQRDQAAAQLELAEGDLARTEALGDLATAQQLQQARTQVDVAEAGLRQARAQLARASITAPFAGIVSDVGVEPGEVAGPGTPVVRLVQLDPVKVVVAVSDRDVVTLEEGMEVTVGTPAQGQRHAGRIARISPTADLNTRAFEVDVEVANPSGELLPGMVASVTARRDLGEGFLVPQDWILSKGQTHGVYVEVDGFAEWREVTLGQVVRNQVFIDAGLSEGDRVVMVGHRELLAGDALLVAREGTCCADGRAQF